MQMPLEREDEIPSFEDVFILFFDKLDKGRSTGKREVKAASLSPGKISDSGGEKKMKFEVLLGLPMSRLQLVSLASNGFICIQSFAEFLFLTFFKLPMQKAAEHGSHIILHVLNQLSSCFDESLNLGRSKIKTG